MAGSLPDEDESVLDLAEQTRRPKDTAFRQQRVRSWNPYLDPFWVICTFFVIGAIFVPVGFKILNLSRSVVEIKRVYDAHDQNLECSIDQPNEGKKGNKTKTCSLTIEVDEDLSPPILIHYEIDNFYQNHRAYKTSLDLYQLEGDPNALGTECKPLRKLGGIVLNPCGLIANTLFNDIIMLNSTASGNSTDGNLPLIMREDGIAWQSDLRYLYKQPNGFETEACPGACDETCCTNGTTSAGQPWSCREPYFDEERNQCFRYFYPKDDTTQYLYETYPEVVSPLEGVKNEHFAVWMRVATLPKFRKLYGWIDQPIAAGTVLQFDILANWEIKSFEGTKTLVVSTNNIFGGKNPWLGNFYVATGVFCLAVSVFFGAKMFVAPRRVADKRYLKYKED